ncbi:MAG TPA: invasion associated locus B family protein [Xanthobacteraceae bacterium]|nr:invasion associated locus B family protein [Xanthobacteraceae bacterium]
MRVAKSVCVLAGLIFTVHTGNAFGQSPQRTTASYDDWTVRCEAQGNPPQKSCEIVQVVQMQGQPLSQIAIGRAAKNEPLKIVFQVPLNVWLPGGVKLVYDPKEPPLAGIFKRCVPTACFSDLDLKDEVVRKFRTRTEQGRLEFKDAAQRDVAIPVSFKGFAQAFDAMARE